MSEENLQETAGATETTEAAAGQPNKAALAALDRAAALTGDATSSPAAAPVPAEGKTRKKKASGRHKTRAELAALVKEYQSGARQPGAKVDAPAAAAPPAPVQPVFGDSAAKEKFAQGVARVSGAVSRFVARRRGVHWQFDDIETGAIGEAAADCLEAGEQMAPSLTPVLAKAMNFAPFAILAGVLYEIVDSRLEVDQEIAAGKRSLVMPGAEAAQLKAVK